MNAKKIGPRLCKETFFLYKKKSRKEKKTKLVYVLQMRKKSTPSIDRFFPFQSGGWTFHCQILYKFCFGNLQQFIQIILR